MKAIHFNLSGRFAHFLKAEAGVNALSYPIPTRTILLGIIGAVLGLEKDTPQVILEPAYFAIQGKMPQRHWHRAKLRKDPPTPLPYSVRKDRIDRQITKPETATLILQEWLIDPEYEVWVSLQEPYHSYFLERLKMQKWYYQPYLGLSELVAKLDMIASYESNQVVKLPMGKHDVDTVLRYNNTQINLSETSFKNTHIQLLQMPRSVTKDRIFTNEKYLWEVQGYSLPVKTSDAYQIGSKVVMFL